MHESAQLTGIQREDERANPEESSSNDNIHQWRETHKHPLDTPVVGNESKDQCGLRTMS